MITGFHIPLSRRRVLRSLVLGSGGLLAPGALAELLTTPGLTEGPYFPDDLPLDQDNDLVKVSDHLSSAVGTITHLTGRVLDASGNPVKGALVEIWQADNNGCYIHTRGALRDKERDPHFQGYGKFETAKDGAWKFRTIKPGLYTGRARHFHFGITPGKNAKRFTTQLHFEGEPENERDGVLASIRDPKRRALVLQKFKVDPETKHLSTHWDIILGVTPSDGHG
jgi:protocatechuate 3,4-dioxygenase beta subunit